MRRTGLQILKGLGITLKHFLGTYVSDVFRLGRILRARRMDHGVLPQGPGTQGIFTVQYPEQRKETGERFRVFPMLLFDGTPERMRCTACGICARVCPSQCIWIVPAKDPGGKPLRRPAEFTLDLNVCMNCGLCAEHCPFDSIKMSSRSEICSTERRHSEVRTLGELLAPAEEYARTHPVAWRLEQEKQARKAALRASAGAPEKGGS